MVRTQLYLPSTTYSQLKKIAKQEGKTFAELARDALQSIAHGTYQQAYKKANKSDSVFDLNTMFEEIEALSDPNDPGITDGSINHDHYLYGAPKKQIKWE